MFESRQRGEAGVSEMDLPFSTLACPGSSWSSYPRDPDPGRARLTAKNQSNPTTPELMRRSLFAFLFLISTLISCSEEPPLGVQEGDPVRIILKSGVGISRGVVDSFTEKTISVKKIYSLSSGKPSEVIVFQVENISSLTFLPRQ